MYWNWNTGILKKPQNTKRQDYLKRKTEITDGFSRNRMEILDNQIDGMPS